MRHASLMPLLLLAGCPLLGGDDSEEGEPRWYPTCGDPACQGYTGPFEGVELCTDQTLGESCDTLGASCDPQDDCNALVTCATSDPTQQEGGCPISLRAYKRDITYLDGAARAEAAREALSLRLSTWAYNWDAPGAASHLGFIIDDAPGSAAVAADGRHVDLYGYTSLVLAAVQEQQRTIEDQRATIDAQQRRIEAMEARLQALESR